MERRTLADRLQTGFDRRPLTQHHPMPPALPMSRSGRRAGKFALVAAFVVLGISVFTFGSLIVDGIWWNVHSVAECTVTTLAHHPVYSKSGFLGTDWNVGTRQCGRLEVTRDGERFPDAAAQKVGRSLVVGGEYRLQLRGWDGWPENGRGIVAAVPTRPSV